MVLCLPADEVACLEKEVPFSNLHKGAIWSDRNDESGWRQRPRMEHPREPPALPGRAGRTH